MPFKLPQLLLQLHTARCYLLFISPPSATHEWRKKVGKSRKWEKNDSKRILFWTIWSNPNITPHSPSFNSFSAMMFLWKPKEHDLPDYGPINWARPICFRKFCSLPTFPLSTRPACKISARSPRRLWTWEGYLTIHFSSSSRLTPWNVALSCGKEIGHERLVKNRNNGFTEIGRLQLYNSQSLTILLDSVPKIEYLHNTPRHILFLQ